MIFPVDRSSQNRLEIGVIIGLALVRPVQPLFLQVFQPRQKGETQQVAKAKPTSLCP
jgi:hypothetical protein